MNRMSCSTVLAAACLLAAWGAGPAGAAPQAARTAQQAVRVAAAVVDVPLSGGAYSSVGGECVTFSGDAIVEATVDVTPPANGANTTPGTIQVAVHWGDLAGAGMRTGTEYGGLGVSRISIPFTASNNFFQTTFRADFNLVPEDILLLNRPNAGDIRVNAVVQLMVRPSGAVAVQIRLPANVCQPSPLQFPPVRNG